MESIEILLPLALILVGARLVGRLSQRLGMPAVLGELVAGLILGPSVLGWIHPNEVLNAVAGIGVLLLMFIAGLETDMSALQQVGKPSIYSALAGVVLPFFGGYAVSMAYGLDTATSLFIGTALTATSVSISVQTLREMGRLQSKEGLIILGAAIIDDVLGIFDSQRCAGDQWRRRQPIAGCWEAGALLPCRPVRGPIGRHAAGALDPPAPRAARPGSR